jgi:hypothetical protein
LGSGGGARRLPGRPGVAVGPDVAAASAAALTRPVGVSMAGVLPTPRIVAAGDGCEPIGRAQRTQVTTSSGFS